MSEIQDGEDVQRALRGDTHAFRGIVERWQGRLVDLAFRFCRDRHRAEDLAQAAFLHAFQRLGQWREDGAFRSWLLALASNLYRSELRRHPPPAPGLPGDPVDPASVAATDTDAGARIRTLVHALPTRYRDVLILHYFNARDVRATARQLGVREGTVKARLHRARELLRRALTEDELP